MYIKHVTIKNFRNFGETPFEIDLKPFTLILGENNIGKTNLINALGLIFSQEITIFRKRVLEIDDFNYETVRKFKKKVCDTSIPSEQIVFPEIRIDTFVTDLTEEQKAIVSHWAINTDISESQLTYRFSLKSNFSKGEWIEKQRSNLQNSNANSNSWINLIDFPIQDYRYSLFGGNDPSKSLDSYWLQMLKMEILEALRDATKELNANSNSKPLYKILNQNSDTSYTEIKQTLEKLDNQISSNKKLGGIKIEVKKLLDMVSLQTSNNNNVIDFLFSGVETSEILKKLGLVYGINPIDISRNGLGRNNLLFISLILSQLSATTPQGDKSYFRLITIEEPESHLHPQLQDHLAKNIERIRSNEADEMQLLLTSHSTHITAKLSLENTCVLYRNEQTNSIQSHYILEGLDVDKNLNTISYLSRYLDATKARMFFARKIILVEGFAEQFLVPEFFKLHFKGTTSVEQAGIAVINVNGVAFKHFLKIIENGYFIKCLVLTDQDTGTKTEKRALKLKEEFDNPELVLIKYTKLSTFEKDLIDENKSGKGKKLFLDTLQAIKPTSGKKFASQTGKNDINVENFFREIEHYKSEFAFQLAERSKKEPESLTIPEYIRTGFTFLHKE